MTSDEIEAAIQYRLQKYKERCTKKGREFNLPYSDFKQMLLADCYYCGLPASESNELTHNGIKYRSNGIDRKNSSQGYFTENCVPCCILCNTTKSDLRMEDWLHYIHRIAARHPAPEGYELNLTQVIDHERDKNKSKLFAMHQARQNSYANGKNSA